MKKNIAEALHNLSLAENDNEDISPINAATYRGLIMGVISSAESYQEGVNLVRRNLPADCIDLGEILPESMCDSFGVTYKGVKTRQAMIGSLLEITPSTRHVEVTIAAINFCRRRIGFADLKKALQKTGFLE